MPPSDESAERVRRLLEERERLGADYQRAQDRLADAAFEVCEVEGASRAGLAKAIGVSPTAVRMWVKQARQRRREAAD